MKAVGYPKGGCSAPRWRPRAARASQRRQSRRLSCQAVAEELSHAQARLRSTAADLATISEPRARLAALVSKGQSIKGLEEADKRPENQVMGCTAQVWLTVSWAGEDAVAIAADSDSSISRGLAAVLIEAFSGLSPRDIDRAQIEELEALALGPALAAPSRTNAFRNMFRALQKRARALMGELPTFPSLLITADSLEPQGAFAEAQAQYLQPSHAQVDKLASVLRQKQVGVVAHFYMDPEVQGVLTSAMQEWPHIAISDSLVMAQKACDMAAAGCKAICVLGVDFMSENVRAILDDAGHTDVAVYRMAAADIGCSLAEAAESPAYERYLSQAAAQQRSMHVVYINTSLRTKALADAAVPTITCTSSNVVQTVLQGFAQVPDLHVYYGPDTYMGRNLAQMFQNLATMPDDAVAALHPAHTAATVREYLPRLHHFTEGTCIVHEVFGGETCDLVRRRYPDAYVTAHFEVPGEMFTLALEAQEQRGMGVVGSTSNILGFIADKVSAAMERGFPDRLQFILGTEAGMITSIVRRVQSILRDKGAAALGIDVEIVFPVAPDAITTAGQSRGASAEPVVLPGGISVVPGPASGEGCSLEGGCAACPYMKMNTLSALLQVCERVGDPAGEAMLEAQRPRVHTDLVNGKTIAQAGCKPILHMNAFMKSSKLPDQLVNEIVQR